jgi:hypothetical protein
MGHWLPVCWGGWCKRANSTKWNGLGTRPFALDHSWRKFGPQKKDGADVHHDYCRIPDHGRLDRHILLGTGLPVNGRIHWPCGIAAAAYLLGTAVALEKQHGEEGVQCTGGPVLEPGVAGSPTLWQSGYAELIGSA